MRFLKPLTTWLALGVLTIIVGCGDKLPDPIADHGSPYYDNLESAKLVAGVGNKTILLDFYTDW